MDNVTTLTTALIDKLNEDVRNGLYEHGNERLFGGAGIVISKDKVADNGNGYITVVSKYAVELSSVIYSLRDIFSGKIDYLTKFEFFGRLAEAANKYQRDQGDNAGVVQAVIDESRRMASELQ